jgi:phage shock protein C
MVCNGCSNEMSEDVRFCSACGRAVVGEQAAPVRPEMTRPRQGRAIAGVCASFAQHFGWEVVPVRLLLCLAVLFGCGTPILAYLIAWIVIPNGPYFVPFEGGTGAGVAAAA